MQSDIERKLKALKPTLTTRFNVDKIGYFGSFVRNEQTDSSLILLFHFTNLLDEYF